MTFEIKGGAELQRALREFPVQVERRLLRGATKAGAEIIADEAKRLVPVDSGELRNTIRVEMSTRRGTVTASIAAGEGRKGWYAHIVELTGSAPHEIRPKGAASLFFAGLLRKVVEHPGMAPKPFMRPAFDGRAQAALDAMAAYLRTRIPQVAARLARRAK